MGGTVNGGWRHTVPVSMTCTASDASSTSSSGQRYVFDLSDPEVGPFGIPSLHLSGPAIRISRTLPRHFSLS